MPSLRVMTYNVRYFGHGTGGIVSTRGGMERIADAIAAMTPLCDVIALQEIEDHSLRSSLVTWHPEERKSLLGEWSAALDRALERRGLAERYEAHYFPAHRYAITGTTHLYTTGLAVLVGPRVTVLSEDENRIEDITHRRGAKALKQTRICAHLTLGLTEASREGVAGGRDVFDVFNTHMSLPGPFYSEFWTGDERMGFGPNQLHEARRIVEAIRQRARTPRVVLLGDFNSLPGSPVDRLFADELALEDALARTLDLDAKGRSSFATAGFLHLRMAIDRIYASTDIRWENFDGTIAFEAPSPFDGLSDHVPLVGTLRLD